ncbi:ABC transporter substrate-binding protein [Paenibacillus alkalitolerans]|uniref:ABC transporter substrate-binding protein n=1 Tax=Paenibacillus alkalitolerans TaxID=2799335 RepID=UPI0018F75EBC|nr:extracellular solute-binding protein [Paenibacillus alkalitolerans]
MTKKSLFALLTLVLALSVFLTACGGGNNANNASNDESSEQQQSNTNSDSAGEEPAPPKEVSFTIGYASGDPATRQAMANAIKAFADANPHIKIKDISETGTASYLDWLKTKDAVGEYPDLVELRDVQVFVDAGRVAELPSDLHDIFKSLPELNGKKYVAPIVGNAPQGIIYSKKAYADAGITELPKTYDEFIAIQEKLKASGISPIVVGGKDIWHMGFWLNKFLIDQVYANDPHWNSKRTAKQVSFTDANVAQAMTDYKDLFTKYVDKGWLSTADNQTASILVTGKAAQLFSGPWMFTQIKEADPNFEFGFYAIPDRQGNLIVNGLPTLAGWSFSAEASKDADKVEAMKSFIRFFFSKEQYTKFLETANALPTTAEPITYESTEQFAKVLEYVNDPNVKKSLMINNWWGDDAIPPQFRNWYYKLMQEMVVENGDVTEYMKRADAEYDNQVIQNQK